MSENDDIGKFIGINYARGKKFGQAATEVYNAISRHWCPMSHPLAVVKIEGRAR